MLFGASGQIGDDITAGAEGFATTRPGAHRSRGHSRGGVPGEQPRE
jgi:hypothetical protein